MVTRIDQAGPQHASRICRTSSAPSGRAGASLKATEQPIDTGTAAAGKCFFDMPGVFAEFEMNLRRERQLDCWVKGLDGGAAFAEGHELEPAAKVPKQIGRMQRLPQAKQLLERLER
jgi:hypothetical protein